MVFQSSSSQDKTLCKQVYKNPNQLGQRLTRCCQLGHCSLGTRESWKARAYLCSFAVPGVGHGVGRRQRLAGPHRVRGARRPRLQHDTRAARTPPPSSLIHRTQHSLAPPLTTKQPWHGHHATLTVVRWSNSKKHSIVYCGTCENSIESDQRKERCIEPRDGTAP